MENFWITVKARQQTRVNSGRVADWRAFDEIRGTKLKFGIFFPFFGIFTILKQFTHNQQKILNSLQPKSSINSTVTLLIPFPFSEIRPSSD